MVCKIIFISTIFFYFVNIWEPGDAMPSESTVAKFRKRNTYEEHMHKAPNEKDSQKIFQYNNKIMLPVANTSLHSKDSPIIFLNIIKLNMHQYKDSNLEKNEKEIIYDNDESDALATTKNSLSNETQQLPTSSISRNNDPTNNNSDIIEKVNETNLRRMFDTKNIINHEEGQDLQDLDVTELSDAVTHHGRLCYVCNSIYDPSCWSPGRKTVVKYCRQPHQLCLTHLNIRDGAKYVVRECGSTCISTTFSKSSESFASCTVCRTDLCNSAHYLKTQNFIFFLLPLFKLVKN